ncbi:MAG: MCE family protein, partial [Mycobacterium sp.]
MSAVGAKSKANRQAVRALSAVRRRIWQVSVLLAAALMLSSCTTWRGVANVALPGGPGSAPGSYTVYAQMPDTLALNGNSRVLVADVYVGTVRAINLKNWVATLTLELSKDVKLPKNATAKIGQTSLLGSQHVELAAPADPSPQPLKNGDTISLKNSSTYPSFEQVLATLSLILRGGGVPNLEVLQNEVYNVFNGRGDQIKALLGKLDTFTAQLNEQRDDIT